MDRYIRGLTSYDLLGNVIPGSLLLLVVTGTFPTYVLPDTVEEYLLFLLGAFVLGSILQAYASKAEGNRKSFDRTLAEAETLAELARGADQSEDREPSFPMAVYWRLIHPFVGPISWPWTPERGAPVDDKILVNRIWEHLVDTYETPYNTEAFSVFYRIMSSKVDNIQSPTRASRFQAIRNFHRGMWMAAWASLGVLIVPILLGRLFTTGDTIVDGVVYRPSAFSQQIVPYWSIVLLIGLSVPIFWTLFEYYEEDYIEYLFADYAVSISSESTEVRIENRRTD